MYQYQTRFIFSSLLYIFCCFSGIFLGYATFFLGLSDCEAGFFGLPANIGNMLKETEKLGCQHEQAR